MDNIGLDVHKRETQICILTVGGAMTEHRLPTRRERLMAFFARRPSSRILLESSTESEWVARSLESLGHEVIVADPSYTPMYGRARRIKTDRRDARALAEALRSGTYRRAHRVSDRQRHVRVELQIRDALVRTRTRYINMVRARLRQEGQPVTLGHPPTFLARVAARPVPALVTAELTPLGHLIATLTAEIAAADARLQALAARDPIVLRLQGVPGIGPITALAFVAALDDVTRFATAREVPAYLGLVPGQRSSGDRERPGRITKTGPTHLRWLLVEAGWRILRSREPRVQALRAWGERIAQRRGKRIAVVAIARRLGRILFAVWRDDGVFGEHSSGRAVA